MAIPVTPSMSETTRCTPICPVPTSATCTPPPGAETSPAVIRSYAAVGSTHSLWDRPSGLAPAPAPVAACPPPGFRTPPLPAPRAARPSRPPCSPSPRTPRHGLAATSPCGSIPPWWLRNRLFPGLFLPPWSAHPMSFAPQINASHVAANHRQSFDLSSTACTILAIVLHPDPPFRARPPRLAFHGI